MVVLDGLFFLWGTLVKKKVVAGHIRQVVVLYSNACTRICLSGLRIGCLTEVDVWAGLTVIL